MTVPHYIKWAGGKRRLSTVIRDLFGGPCTGTYIEPFLGSGAIYFERAAAGEINRAHLADINEGLVAVHRTLRDQPNEVITALSHLPTKEGTWRDSYYERRETFRALKVEAEEAKWSPKWFELHGPTFTALFLWINRACFNGLYRENKKGVFNAPIGSYKTVAIKSPEVLLTASKLLEPASIIAHSFQDALYGAQDGDHIYADPPYVPISDTANFVAYSKDGFTWKDHVDLAEIGAEAGNKGAKVVLSNANTPQVRELYADLGYRFKIIPTSRSIGAAGKTRKKVTEVLAIHSPGSAGPA